MRVAASVALLLASGCREVRPGRLGPARGSSLSVFHRMALALILRTGSESAWAEAPNLAGRAWRDNRLAAGAVPLTHSV